VLQAKKLGKAVYVFSVDSEGGKVIHVNHVPASLKAQGLDARTWAARVTEVLGGKVGYVLLSLFNKSKMAAGWRQGRWRAGRWPQYGQSQGSPRDCAKVST
jgi:hypothetical protein